MPIYVEHSIVLKHCQQTGIVWCFETNRQRMHKFVSHGHCPIAFIATFRVLDVLSNGHDSIENLHFCPPTMNDGVRATPDGVVIKTVVFHSENPTDLSHCSKKTLYSEKYGLVSCENRVNPTLTFEVEIVVNDLDYISHNTNLFKIAGRVHSVACCDDCLEDSNQELNRFERNCRIFGTRTKRQLVPFHDFHPVVAGNVERLERLNPSRDQTLSKSALLALYGLPSRQLPQ